MISLKLVVYYKYPIVSLTQCKEIPVVLNSNKHLMLVLIIPHNGQ